MTEEKVPFKVFMPPSLKRSIAIEAAKAGRRMSEEVVVRLEASLTKDAGGATDAR